MIGGASWRIARQLVNQLELGRTVRLVFNPGSNGNLSIRTVLFAGGKNAVRGNVQSVCFGQPDVAIDSRAFVEPAFDLTRVDSHHHRIRSTFVDVVGNVAAKPDVAALVAADLVAIEPYFALAKDPIELQTKSFTFIRGRNIKRLAIPPDRCRGERSADWLVTMIPEVLVVTILEW